MGKHYTLCFLFNEDLTKTLLIKKAEGKLFAGKYNALGGKLEDGETALQAVIREVFEESMGKIVLENPKYIAVEHFPISKDVPINGAQTLEVYYDIINEIEIPEGPEGVACWMPMEFALDFNNQLLVGHGNIPYQIRRALRNEEELRKPQN